MHSIKFIYLKALLISLITLFVMTSAGVSTTGSSETDLLWKPVTSLYDELHLDEEGLDKEVFDRAMNGYQKLQPEIMNAVLSIADFSKSSNEKRLYIIDLQARKLIHKTYVAHGRNSGDEYASVFSDVPESFQSSLGFYLTGEVYEGAHGISLRLEGMESGINGNAGNRAIVIHGADYVSEDFIKKYGRLGRSYGCPAVSNSEAEPIISTVKNGSCFFIHYPDPTYNTVSTLVTP